MAKAHSWLIQLILSKLSCLDIDYLRPKFNPIPNGIYVT